MDLKREIARHLDPKRQRRTVKEMTEVLRDLLFFDEFQIFEQSVYSEGGDHTNLVGLRGPSGPGGLLLIAPLGRAVGLSRPTDAKPHWEAGRIYSPDALSGWIQFLIFMEAATRIPQHKLKRPLYVAGLFGGELSPEDGTSMLAEHPVIRPTWAVIGSPTDLELGIAHRGHLVIELKLRRHKNIWRLPRSIAGWHVSYRGSGAPGAAPQLGDNAALAALDHLATYCSAASHRSVHNLEAGERANSVPATASAIVLSADGEPPTATSLSVPGVSVDLRPVEDDITVSFPVSDALSVLRGLLPAVRGALDTPPRFDGAQGAPWPPPVWNLGRLRTEADGLTLTLEFRGTADHDVEALTSAIEAAAASAVADRPNHSVDLEVVRDRPPMHLAEHSRPEAKSLVQMGRRALQSAGLPTVESECDTHTEAWLLNALDIPTLVFGPGRARTHAGADVYLDWLHVEKAAAVTAALAKRLTA